MKSRAAFWGIVTLCVAAVGIASADDPTREQLLDAVGIKPSESQRGQMDTVGFVTTPEQMDAVLEQSGPWASTRLDTKRTRHGWTKETWVSAAVCPHDDYYYASRLYSLVLPFIKAKHVIVFGVFHKARVFGCRDQLVFDSFQTWRGPYGPVTVSSLRTELIGRLPADAYVVDNDMQTVEHSVEAIVPWLQAFNRDVEIVSILVPYMEWETMDGLAADLTRALVTIMREKGWKLGEDVALISSADAVHYGDAGWGGGNYADFGADIEGYRAAVDRDRDLIASTLAGEVNRNALEEFLYTCVDRNDVMEYKLSWCGRFSVPFGLNVASRLCETIEGRPLQGTVLDYGTSVGESSLDLDAIPGLGTTAPNNLHHWVGYPAIVYR
jgi:AmmeMemoRadiSam system protein B